MPELGTHIREVGFVGLGKLLNGAPRIGMQDWSRSNRLPRREHGFAYGSAYRQTVPTGEIMLLPW